jgi:hypothetical protein
MEIGQNEEREKATIGQESLGSSRWLFRLIQGKHFKLYACIAKLSDVFLVNYTAILLEAAGRPGLCPLFRVESLKREEQ